MPPDLETARAAGSVNPCASTKWNSSGFRILVSLYGFIDKDGDAGLAFISSIQFAALDFVKSWNPAQGYLGI